ncbi:MAG: sigma factor regulatory protein, FecR/PupR family [Bacteroidetes bacterium]|nr:sigma factor regulatory protein, FecR/PupR family [Bacteroidota bacterium]
MQTTEKEYMTYKAVDFAKDLRFIGWRLSPNSASNKFWSDFQKEHPEMKLEINRAIEILQSVRLNRTSLSPEEEKMEVGKLKKRITDRKRQLTTRYILYVAAAACLFCAVFMLQNVSISENKIDAAVAQASKDIQLISDDHITILPQNAIIECKADGTILIESSDKKSSSVKSALKMNRLIVPKGKRSSLLMPDGTKIWIASGSELEFPTMFANNKRQIRLSGEAYLEVAKDRTKPFTVNGDDFSVEVLGTKFNISAYRGNAFKQVVLLEGSVKVNSGSKRSLTLSPNQMATITENDITASEVDAYDYISWKDGILTLSSYPLNQVLHYLERYYDVEIKSSPETDVLKCNGKLILTDNIENVLDCIQSTMPIKIEKENNQIKICLTNQN